MAGLVPAIHAFIAAEDVDARHKAGHDQATIICTSRGYIAAILPSHLVSQTPFSRIHLASPG
jgi:hypothetical protein